MEDESYLDLQIAIMEKPDSGSLIRKSGGLRKIRWKAGGKGKSGGVRVVYYWWVKADHVLMLDIYPKNEKEDLSASELADLRKEMEDWIHENER